ncbi:protocatechuate 3,4-dioxygenase beta subunit [Arthrobacter stackebrandtii]|uniref:Protocatechuate 3,4-dioxygenase beta subunit n=1 Tax=Arthrobacter stackebrandtii TaxID=272161 RepID=A0ABS4YWC8_9MICC|nr:intradiol ring-cleavage dioxygenase [Arthrobacter stackebrandtii]MBP2413126.1 protocatechuate 3,4-dioxygenase beta subunit [Arthrobacter stackebrandtii]PYH01107.1 3,4-dioxygenase subunit beta [Arthrobacter stackebrandtii]
MDKNTPHPNHDKGLEFDLGTILSRRRTLGLVLGAGAIAGLTACAPAPETAAGTAPGTTAAPGSTTPAAPSAVATATSEPTAEVTRAIAECAANTPDTPEETGGPYPADGSNGPDVLTASGVVRQDIRGSFGASTAQAEGIPLTVTLTLLDNAQGCKPLAGAAVYLWHATRDGKYSLYDQGLENENFLRGVQETDANGRLSFTTIFPGAYNGRWPHIHFEVFESMSNATSAGQILRTSQIAMTEASCNEVYATAGYESSLQNFPRTPLARDMVFGDDGGIHQLASTSGSAADGYSAALNVVI